MTEQEKLENVIKGLECCMGQGQCYGICENCPYNTDKMRCDLGTLHQEALKLLKEQEPVEPSWRRGIPFCGKCGRQFGRGFKYCPDCGRVVKWE